MDVGPVTEPDTSTDRGIDMDSILGPLFWGTFFSCVEVVKPYRTFQ